MSSFAPALLGGVLIGIAVAMLLLLNGRVAGVSGIVGGVVAPRSGDWGWRALFLGGLLAGAAAMRIVDPRAIAVSPASLPVLGIAGLLVGFGTRLAGGCTSGHGVCGISRLSRRSIVATCTFMAVAGAVVFLTRHGGGQ